MVDKQLNSDLIDSSILFPKDLANWRVFTSGEDGNKKISVKNIETGIHYTLHFGFRSKILDIHLTNEKESTYETIFKISHYSIARLYLLFEKHYKVAMCRYFLGGKINLGKLNRYNCILAKIGGNQSSFDTLYNSTKKGKDSISYKIRKQINKEAFEDLFLRPSEIHSTQCEYFDVFKIKKGVPQKIGSIFKNPKKPASNNLYFISNKHWIFFQAVIDWGILSSIDKVDFLNKEIIANQIKKSIADRYKGTTTFRRLKKDLEKPFRQRKY